MPTEADILEALENIIDPEVGLDLVEMGLIYDVSFEKISDDLCDVYITYTLTSPGCPIGPQIHGQIIAEARTVPGVRKVFPNLTWQPAWNPEMISEDGRFALGF